MQLFVRCGAPHGSVVVDASASTIVATIKAGICDKYRELWPTPRSMVRLYTGNPTTSIPTGTCIHPLHPQN